MRNGFNTKVTEPQNLEIPAVYLTSWLQRHADRLVDKTRRFEYYDMERDGLKKTSAYFSAFEAGLWLASVTVIIASFFAFGGGFTFFFKLQ